MGNHRLVKFLAQIFFIFVIATVSIVLYDTYANIDVEEEVYETQKLSQETTVEETSGVSEMLEKAAESVVRDIKN